MAGVLAPASQQYFDNNGDPLSGGKIFTYAAGTSTPLATYSNYDLTEANTNPVVLDVSGRPESGSVFLTGGTLYKFVVEDSNGVQLYEQDNIGTSSGGSSSSTWPGEAEDIASGSLTDLGTLSSNFANITGTTTINSFGSTAVLTNPMYIAKFEGAVAIINSASILIRSGVTTIGMDITTASGDVAWLEYLGSGSWKIFDFIRGDASINATTATFNSETVLT